MSDVVFWCEIHKAAGPYFEDGETHGPKPRACYPVLVNGDMPIDECRIVERRMVDGPEGADA